tara:strand:+ start:371 stop:613 length:243 start_codon:yes stop_codon:yes gene_type:complete
MISLLKIAKKSAVSYILTQILTAVECATAIVILYFVFGYSIPQATAIAVPISYPIMVLQLVAIYYAYSRYLNAKEERITS